MAGRTADGIFTVRARKCLRCGRLLTSAEAVERGYGCRCAELAGTAGEPPPEDEGVPGQMSLFGEGGKHGW